MEELKLGIIGLSEGNGHPYSWSAIFNGYNKEVMQECPFPVIPQYLSKTTEADRLTGARVTHIWCDDAEVARHVARAAEIEYVVNDLEAMLVEVDAVLLARDDAENHYKHAHKALEAGLPIYIDKPLATNLKAAQNLLDLQRTPTQIFTCSALRYAVELFPTQAELEELNSIDTIVASTPKYWNTYAVHVIEPVIAFLGGQVKPFEHSIQKSEKATELELFSRDKPRVKFSTTGVATGGYSITYSNNKGYLVTKTIEDTYNAFKNSLAAFLEQLQKKVLMISREETLQIIELIELGIK